MALIRWGKCYGCCKTISDHSKWGYRIIRPSNLWTETYFNPRQVLPNQSQLLPPQIQNPWVNYVEGFWRLLCSIDQNGLRRPWAVGSPFVRLETKNLKSSNERLRKELEKYEAIVEDEETWRNCRSWYVQVYNFSDLHKVRIIAISVSFLGLRPQSQLGLGPSETDPMRGFPES